MSRALLLCTSILAIAAISYAAHAAREWRVRRDARTDALLRRGFRANRSWLRVNAAPVSDERSSIDRFRREVGGR